MVPYHQPLSSCLIFIYYLPDYYVKEAAAYYLSVMYVLGGGLLVWYAHLTVQGVSQVPIEIQVRKRKLREVRNRTHTSTPRPSSLVAWQSLLYYMVLGMSLDLVDLSPSGGCNGSEGVCGGGCGGYGLTIDGMDGMAHGPCVPMAHGEYALDGK